MKQFRLLLATMLAFVCTTSAWADDREPITVDGLIYYPMETGIPNYILQDLDKNTFNSDVINIRDVISDGTKTYTVQKISSRFWYEVQYHQKSEQVRKICIPKHVDDISYPLEMYQSETDGRWVPSLCGVEMSFSVCPNLEEFVIDSENECLTISEDFFTNVRNLKTVRLPNKMEFLPESLFWGCTELETVQLPTTVEDSRIPNDFFHYCTSLKNVVLPEGLIDIGHNAFFQCSSLESLSVVSDSLSIGNSCFDHCKNLESFTFSGSALVLGDDAFSQSGLKSIDLSGCKTYLGYFVFGRCQSLTTATLGEFESKSTSGQGCQYTFYGCKALTTATLKLTNGVFSDCAGIFYECSNLQTLHIVDNDFSQITDVPDYAFRGCNALSFDDYMFYYLKNIGRYGFGFIDNLKLKFPSSRIVAAHSDAFYGSSKAQITVGEKLGDYYKALDAYKDLTIIDPYQEPLVPPTKYQEVNGKFSEWFGKYNDDELAVVKRLKLSGAQDEDSWNALKSMCDRSKVYVRLETLDLTDATLNVETNVMNFTGFASLDTLLLPKAAQNYWELSDGLLSGCDPNLVVVVQNNTPASYLTSASAFGTSGSDVQGMTLVVPKASYNTYTSRVPWSYFGNIVVENTVSDSPWVSFVYRSAAAGSFASRIAKMSDREKLMLVGLTLSGPLDSRDLKEIRNLCGAPFTLGDPATGYHVTSLDLSAARFVSDSRAFCNDGNDDQHIVGNNNVPIAAFSGMTQVDSLWLPVQCESMNHEIFKSANPTMKVFVQWNNPNGHTGYQNPFAGRVDQMTLVVPQGKSSIYKNTLHFSDFGNVIEGDFEGVGAEPETLSDNVVLHITRNEGGTVMVKHGVAAQNGSIPVEAVTENIYTMTLPRTELQDDGTNNEEQFEFIVTVPSNMDYHIYMNGADISESWLRKETGDESTVYAWHAHYGLLLDEVEHAYISVLFTDKEQPALVPFVAMSNSMAADAVKVKIYDREYIEGWSQWQIIESTEQEVPALCNIPADKAVMVYFSRQPYEWYPTIYVNGNRQSLGFDGTYYTYYISDLSTADAWNLNCTFTREGEPDATVVTNGIMLDDESGLVKATFSFNSGEGESLEEQTVTFDVNVGNNTIVMPKVTIDDKAFVELTLQAPAGYNVHLYDSRYEQYLETDETTTTIDGVEYTTYRWHQTGYQYRMVNQSLVVMVSEPAPTVDWNVSLFGKARAMFIFKQQNGNLLGNGMIDESGLLKVNSKTKMMEVQVYCNDYVEDVEAFRANTQLVVMADGVDLSSYFTTEANWIFNNLGFRTTSDIPIDLSKVKNWMIGLKDKNSVDVTWTATLTGDITDNDNVDIQVNGGDAEIELNPTKTTGTDHFDPDYIGTHLSVSVHVDPQKEVRLFFNGENYTDLLTNVGITNGKKEFRLVGDNYSQFFADGNWTFEIVDPKDIDVNGDGKVTIADAVLIVNKIIGKSE